MLKVAEIRSNLDLEFDLDRLALEGAHRIIAAALVAEADYYVERFQERGPDGRSLVVRNGKSRPRKVTVGSGTIEIEAPRINDKRVDAEGVRQRFTSKILPPYMRKSPKVSEVLPVLYLRGLSTGDFREALPILLGEDASGLSSTAISRLTSEWDKEYQAFSKRDLSDRDYVYVWVDGIHFNVRLEDDRLCTLVMLGVRPDGHKELIAVSDGYRESKESWASLLRDLKRRGMREPMAVIGDGALGFWSAVRDVWPTTRWQRDWFHKLGNVLDMLPKRLQGKAKALLQEAMSAATREQAEEAMGRFGSEYRAKYSKAVDRLEKDRDSLLTFFDFPAEHWKHLRTTNPIESVFATVRLRQRVTKGAGSRKKALLMAWKLADMAQARWRRLNGPHLLPLVRSGARFVDGQLVERDGHQAKDAA